jgi:hypothetical protein
VRHRTQKEWEVAEWLYEIKQISSLKESLESLLREQGEQGWELVQVLSPHELDNGSEYGVIFKREKPLMSKE